MLPSKHLVKISLILIYCEQHLALGGLLCVYNEKQNVCTFSGVLSNATQPYFQPTSLEQHPLNVTVVEVKDSKIPLLTDEFCKTFPNLRILALRECFVERIQNTALSACTNLLQFSIQGNNVTEVSPKLFMNNSKIMKVKFSYNQLTYVDVKIFEPTKNLSRLDLSGNLLVHFDFRTMPFLPYLEKIWIHGNNLLDLDEYAVVEKFPILRLIEYGDNLLDCQNLKKINETFAKNNISIEALDDSYSYRTRSPYFATQKVDEIQCLNRSEHLRASAYYLNELQIRAVTKSLSCSKQPQPDSQKFHVFIIQFVSAILLVFCITMVTQHGFFWQRTVNTISDKGDYYYTNYYQTNPQNARQENVGTTT